MIGLFGHLFAELLIIFLSFSVFFLQLAYIIYIIPQYAPEFGGEKKELNLLYFKLELIKFEKMHKMNLHFCFFIKHVPYKIMSSKARL